ncbi:T9SS type A sorting domain-containing protein [candidate division KSB1 bacterium]|nr:T9SS type A sorting domain-containing protein [candidate division KSB1 bacterium]
MMRLMLFGVLVVQTLSYSQVTMIINKSDGTRSEINIDTIQDITFDLPCSKVDAKVLALARSFSLLQNYPNPFNPTTTISFQLPTAGQVDISIYDITGRQVLHHAQQYDSGSSSFIWQGVDAKGKKVTSGFYICQVKYNNVVQSRKMTFIK